LTALDQGNFQESSYSTAARVDEDNVDINQLPSSSSLLALDSGMEAKPARRLVE